MTHDDGSSVAMATGAERDRSGATAVDARLSDPGPLDPAASRSRVCFVVESGTDVRLVEGLAEHLDLTLLARQIPGGRTISQAPSCRLEATTGPASVVRFGWAVWRHLRRHAGRHDVVIVQGYGLAALAANVAGRIGRVPTLMLVCSPTETYYECRRRHPGSRQPYRWWESVGVRVLARLNARLGSRYVVLSRHLGDVVRAHGGRRPVHVIPAYGIDTTTFRPTDEPRQAIRASLGLPSDGALVFFSSRIAPEKDAEALLEAVKMLRDRGRHVRVLHLSGGHRQFVELSQRLGLAPWIHAADAVRPTDALARYYQASDLCVQASRAEGLGFSPLEALACEVPVVAASVGGLRETVEQERAGWTYAVGDVAGLADSIEAVLDDPAEARSRTRRGRALVARRFERRQVFTELVTLIGSVSHDDVPSSPASPSRPARPARPAGETSHA